MEAIGQTALICAFRGWPFVAYACVARRFSRRGKLVALALYACAVGLVVALRGTHALIWTALGTFYYLLCAMAVPRCALALRAGRVTAGALFALFAIAYLVVPSVALTSARVAPFLVLGWDLLLSSYSYCHDLGRRSEQPRVSRCLFFLFVDPTLTYSSRGRYLGAGVRRGRAAGRVALGIGAIWLTNAVIQPAYAMVLDLHPLVPGAVVLAGFGVLRFLAEYAAHSGLASIQIGLMRQCGYGVRERYVLPWLAKDPLDFWRRWNTYVGAWLRQYVFLPLSRRALSAVDRGGSRRRGLVLPEVVLATLVASGLLHDAYAYLATGTLAFRMVELFFASGMAILLWTLAGRLVDATSRLGAGSTERPRTAWLPRIASGLSRACLAAALVMAAVVWG